VEFDATNKIFILFINSDALIPFISSSPEQQINVIPPLLK